MATQELIVSFDTIVPAPPLTLTPQLLRLAVEVASRVGQLKGLSVERPEPVLRRKNRVRTIQGTAAIEGNTLSADQVTAVLDGKRVIGPRRELLEIENASRPQPPVATCGTASSRGCFASAVIVG